MPPASGQNSRAAGSTYLRIIALAGGALAFMVTEVVGLVVALWPEHGFLPFVIALGAGWGALRLTGWLTWLFVTLAAGLLVYGVLTVAAVRSGAWFQTRTWPRPIRLSNQ
jgi:hypothetical protein